jgi:hypothetical protein
LVRTEDVKQVGIERGILREPTFDIRIDAVMASDFLEQFGNKTRKVTDTLDMPLPADTSQYLSFRIQADKWTLASISMITRRPVPNDRARGFLGHSSLGRRRISATRPRIEPVVDFVLEPRDRVGTELKRSREAVVAHVAPQLHATFAGLAGSPLPPTDYPPLGRRGILNMCHAPLAARACGANHRNAARFASKTGTPVEEIRPIWPEKSKIGLYKSVP